MACQNSLSPTLDSICRFMFLLLSLIHIYLPKVKSIFTNLHFLCNGKQTCETSLGYWFFITCHWQETFCEFSVDTVRPYSHWSDSTWGYLPLSSRLCEVTGHTWTHKQTNRHTQTNKCTYCIYLKGNSRNTFFAHRPFFYKLHMVWHLFSLYNNTLL